MSKVCGKCNSLLDDAAFNKSSRGLQRYCRECSNAANREWYKANKAAVIARTTQYNKDHPEVHAAARVKHFNANKEYYNAWHRARRLEIPEVYRAYDKKRAQDPNRTAAMKAKNTTRSKQMAERGSWSKDDYALILKIFNYECAYCESPATETDHFIPLAKGGMNTIDNIVPACRSCNSRKGTKLLAEWRAQERGFDEQRLETISKARAGT